MGMHGLEADACKDGPAAAAGTKLACGIHIHKGKTCDDAEEIGGHYYGESLEADPWSLISYSVAAGGTARGHIQDVTIGADQDISGHALVVHDSTGGRVACTVLPQSFLMV